MGNQRSVKSQNKRIPSGEATLLKIMKMLKMFYLMLFGHIDLGTDPGHPRVSSSRSSKSQGNGRTERWCYKVWWYDIDRWLIVSSEPHSAPTVMLTGTDSEISPLPVHRAFSTLRLSHRHSVYSTDVTLWTFLLEGPCYFRSHQCHGWLSSRPDPATEHVTRGKLLNFSRPQCVLCQMWDKDIFTTPSKFTMCCCCVGSFRKVRKFCC